MNWIFLNKLILKVGTHTHCLYDDYHEGIFDILHSN